MPVSRFTLLGCLILLLAGLEARASKPRLRLERVDSSQCNVEGTVDAHVVELELEGIVRERTPSEYRLMLDGKPLKKKPTSETSFARSGQALHLTLVIQTDQTYEGAMGQIRTGLRQLLDGMPKPSRVSVVTFDEQVKQHGHQASLDQAGRLIASLRPTAVTADLALTRAIQAGLRGLEQAAAGARRLLVLIANGLDSSPKRDLFRNVGNRARALGVPIHPIGFTPIDERGPLLNLGELAKRSGGTFRWARDAARIPEELANLGQEIGKQLVLTFEVPDGCSKEHRVQVVGAGLQSNTLTVASQGPASWVRGRALRWIVGILGFLLLVAVVGLLSRWIARSMGPRSP